MSQNFGFLFGLFAVQYALRAVDVIMLYIAAPSTIEVSSSLLTVHGLLHERSKSIDKGLSGLFGLRSGEYFLCSLLLLLLISLSLSLF